MNVVDIPQRLAIVCQHVTMVGSIQRTQPSNSNDAVCYFTVFFLGGEPAHIEFNTITAAEIHRNELLNEIRTQR